MTQEKKHHPATASLIILRIVIVISLAELAVMLLFATMQLDLNTTNEAILDAFLLSTVSGPIIYFWVIRPFILSRDKAQNDITYLAMHDPLTGLANRRLLTEFISKTISLCNRDKRYSALFLMDLDKFKPINDEYGHEIGDLVLIDISTKLKDTIREADLAARLGGDEFVVLITEPFRSKKNAEEFSFTIANKLMEQLREPIILADKKLFIGVSIGFRIINLKDKSVESILKDADSAMYSSKTNNRNVTLYSERGYEEPRSSL